MIDSRRFLNSLLILLSTFCLVACDPVLLLAPINLRLISPYKWEHVAGDVTIQTNGPQGLKYGSSLGSEFLLINRSKETISIQSIKFISKGNVHNGSAAQYKIELWDTIEPGTDAEIRAFWILKDELHRAIDQDSKIIFTLLTGGKQTRITIDYER